MSDHETMELDENDQHILETTKRLSTMAHTLCAHLGDIFPTLSPIERRLVVIGAAARCARYLSHDEFADHIIHELSRITVVEDMVQQVWDEGSDEHVRLPDGRVIHQKYFAEWRRDNPDTKLPTPAEFRAAETKLAAEAEAKREAELDEEESRNVN